MAGSRGVVRPAAEGEDPVSLMLPSGLKLLPVPCEVLAPQETAQRRAFVLPD